MEANLPKTPGVYWWRAKDGDEWRAIILTHVDIEAIQEDIPEFGEAYIDGMTISGGQWAKAHKPDDGVEVYLVCDGRGRPIGAGSDVYEALQNFLQCSTSPEADFIALKNKCGYTCEPVTIYRNQDQK